MSIYLGDTPLANTGYGKANTDLSNLTSAGQETLVDILYPVGSIYIGTTSTCPLAAIKGTWELQSSAIVTSVNTNVPCKGTGKSLGFQHGSTICGATANGDCVIGASSNAVNVSFNNNISNWATRFGNLNIVGITTDDSKSGIVGTVTRSTLSVNIWKRTA